MKNRSRLFRVVGAAALLISMLAATVAPAAAQDSGVPDQDGLEQLVGLPDIGFVQGDNTIYYPWVSNDDNFGLGPADTSISIQNLNDYDTTISIYVGNGAGGFDLVTSAYLSAYASKTFHASALGIAEGDGAPVIVTSFNVINLVSYPGLPDGLLELVPAGTIALVETPIILSNPVADDIIPGENDGGDFTQVIACVVNYHLAGSPNLGTPWGYVAVVDHEFNGVDYDAGEWVSFAGVANVQAALQAALNLANEGNLDELINPFGGLNADGDCFDAIDMLAGTFNSSVAIGGVAKQAVDGEALPATSEVDTAVSGYNALNGWEVFRFDQWYLPIVQTNCGPGGCWDSVIRVANVSDLNNAVTIRFFPADDGSGSLQTGFQLEALVNGGDTWNVNLGDLVPDGWVGSAHILSDGAVFAMVDRYKVGYSMWITNTGSSAEFESVAQVPNANGRYALFAPHVLMDYYGWNTGINVANLVAMDNNISIQYFNMLGNATQVLNQRLAAHGMTYFYDPSVAAQDNNSQDVTTDPNAGVVGSAIIWSDLPVAAAVDATKYPETDPNGGEDLFQATSYSATSNVFTWQAVPLVQKGSAIDGMGDTSGINIMNPNSVAATAEVYWVNPSGFQATNFGVGSVTIPAFANGFVYTLWQHNLPNGFTGAAQVVSTVPVAAVSANVNYEVDGDGSAIFNAFNPCGFYRVSAWCSFGDVLQPGGQSVTKYFIVDDEDGEVETTISEDAIGIAGVTFSIVNADGGTATYQRDGVSGTDGSAIFTNIPVGAYELYVTGVPGDFSAPDATTPVDTFVVYEGQDVVLVNELTYGQGFEKTVCIGSQSLEDYLEDLGDDLEEIIGELDTIEDLEIDIAGMDCAGEEEDGSDTIGLVGVNVVVYEVIGEDFLGAPVIGNEPVFEGVTGEDGTVGGNLPSGEYLLCIYDEDASNFLSTVETTSGEEVDILIPDRVYASALCAGGLFDIISWELFGDQFEVVSGEYEELTNAVWVPFSDLDVFVGTEDETGDVGGVIGVAQTGGESLNPLEGIEVCLYPEFGPVIECLVTDEDGEVHFENLFVGEEYYVVVDGDNAFTAVVDAWGGVSNAAWVSVENDSEVEFDHSPTYDVAQDGYASDNDGNGSYDLVIEMGEVEPASLLVTATLAVGDGPAGAFAGVGVTVSDGTCADPGAVIETGTTDATGSVLFEGLAAGDVCVTATAPAGSTATDGAPQTVNLVAGAQGTAIFPFTDTIDG